MAEFKSADALAQGSVLTRGAVAFGLGNQNQPEDVRAILAELQLRSSKEYVPAFYLAVIHAGLRDKDQAMLELERAEEARDGQLVFLKVEPIFDFLRSDPRFIALLQRIGL